MYLGLGHSRSPGGGLGPGHSSSLLLEEECLTGKLLVMPSFQLFLRREFWPPRGRATAAAVSGGCLNSSTSVVFVFLISLWLSGELLSFIISGLERC